MFLFRDNMRRAAYLHAASELGTVALLLALLLALFGCGESAASNILDEGPIVPGSTNLVRIVVANAPRDYLLHVPPGGALKKFPLVILLHGSGQNGESIREIARMDSLADARQFVVAYPNGLENDWNAGNCCGSAQSANVDDIAFIRAVIADESKKSRLDPLRVYIGGFSDGARMAYRAGCEMSAQIAAIAVVSGSLVKENCAPSRAVPLVAFHGTADGSVSFNEPAATVFPRPPPVSVLALPPSVRFWQAADSCQRTSYQQDSPHVYRSSGVTCKADVVFYLVSEGGHSWPSLGAGDELSASAAIATFFLAHRLP